MKEKYDVPIAPESEFVSYMMEQMTKFGLSCTEEQAKDFYVYYARMMKQIIPQPYGHHRYERGCSEAHDRLPLLL